MYRMISVVISIVCLITTNTFYAQADTYRPSDRLPEIPISQSSPIATKMVWANYVGWGHYFEEEYEQPDTFMYTHDRSLEGRWVSTQLGVKSTTRQQILTAMRYGLDGFIVNYMSNKDYPAIGRMYSAAEGLPFKIALCVDGWQGSVEEITDDLEAYFNEWGDHPNNYFIDGLPVIFIYAFVETKSPDKVKQVLDLLAERGHRAYWLMQPIREWVKDNDPETIQTWMKLFDGLYDFGVNGRTQEQMRERLKSWREGMNAVGKNGLVCGGITQGYLGGANSFYRPYFNTGTLRDNWAAALQEQVDWVCLTTYNDYIESTHFEPSVWGRDVMLLLNQEIARQWKDQPLTPRPPQVLVSYHRECRLGDDWTLEVASLPYTTKNASAYVRLTDLDGEIIKEWGPIELPKDRIGIKTLRLHTPGLQSEERVMRVWTGVQDNGEDSIEWSHLYPVHIRPAGMRTLQVCRFNLSDIEATPETSVTHEDGKWYIRSGFEGWSWLGRATLLRNGRPIQHQDIAKLGGVRVETEFSFSQEERRFPVDTLVIRFDREDGKVSYSEPVQIGADEADNQTVAFPVVIRDLTLNEGWGMGNRSETVPIKNIKVPDHEIFKIILPMDTGTETEVRDIGPWHWPVLAGEKGNAFRLGMDPKINEDHKPTWLRSTGPHGDERWLLQFDGQDDRLVFPIRTLPNDTVTVETWVRPQFNDQDMYLFSDQNGGLDLGIDGKGHLFAERAAPAFMKVPTVKVASPQPLTADRWSHVAASYDGEELSLWVNGKKVNEIACSQSVVMINSIPAVGVVMREGHDPSEGFKGEMAGFALQGRPINRVKDFQMLKSIPSSDSAIHTPDDSGAIQ